MRDSIPAGSSPPDPESLVAAQRQRRRLGGTLFGLSVGITLLHLCFAGFVTLLMFVSVPFGEQADPISSPLNERFHWLWNLVFVPWLPAVLVLLAGIFGYRSVVKSVRFHGTATCLAGVAAVSNLGMFYVNSVLGDAVGGLFGVLHGVTVLLALADVVVVVLAVRLWRFTEGVRRDAYRQVGFGS